MLEICTNPLRGCCHHTVAGKENVAFFSDTFLHHVRAMLKLYFRGKVYSQLGGSDRLRENTHQDAFAHSRALVSTATDLKLDVWLL